MVVCSNAEFVVRWFIKILIFFLILIFLILLKVFFGHTQNNNLHVLIKILEACFFNIFIYAWGK